MGNLVNFPMQNYYEQEDESCEYEYEMPQKVQVKEIVIKSQMINNTYAKGHLSTDFKIINFESKQELIDFEKQECGNKFKNVSGSWISCIDKFKEFPCDIGCKYVYFGEVEGYRAIYMTSEEMEEDLLDAINQLRNRRAI